MPYTVDFSVDKNLDFVDNTFTFSADISASTPLVSGTYEVIFNDGATSAITDITATSAGSATHSYSSRGIYNTVSNLTLYNVAGTTEFTATSALAITVNPLPEIAVLGTPNINESLTFYDVKGGYYVTNTVVSADWDFGDGYTSAITDTSDTLVHVYSAVGLKSISVSAYDTSGNVGIGTASVGILGGSSCVTKEDYITTCGPEMLNRFGSNREIDLIEFLPQYLRGGETEQLLQIFQNTINELYDGSEGWDVSANNLTVNKAWDGNSTTSNEPKRDYSYDLNGTNTSADATSVSAVAINWPNSSLSASPKISMLEKIHRIAELHDPDLIDIEYIQYFASNLGYKVDIYRDELGISGTSADSTCGTAETNRYLRFMVRNLPTWYKIKTTRNAIKVMLYSFGLVGDILTFYTEDYLPRSQGGSWLLDYNDDLEGIPNSWYPTPHFSILIDINDSADISFDINRREKLIRAIESIRPINTVFRRLTGYLKRTFYITTTAWMRMTRYREIKSNGYSNSWWDGTIWY